MITFIADQRTVHRVQSICRVLPFAPSTYYHQLVCRADRPQSSARAQTDAEPGPEIQWFKREAIDPVDQS